MCPYNACKGNDPDCWCVKELAMEAAPVRLIPESVAPRRHKRDSMPEDKYEWSRCDRFPEGLLTTAAKAKRQRRQAREAGTACVSFGPAWRSVG